MSQWIRNYNPSESDSDEWGHILVMRDNGIKSVYHWQDYNEESLNEQGVAWMTLPKSDVPESISITIERGDRSWRIENNGGAIEIHDSRDPMGQPAQTIFAVTADTNMNALFADAVLSVLESEDEDEDWCECEGEGVVVKDDVVQDFLDALRGKDLYESLRALRGKDIADEPPSRVFLKTGLYPVQDLLDMVFDRITNKG